MVLKFRPLIIKVFKKIKNLIDTHILDNVNYFLSYERGIKDESK